MTENSKTDEFLQKLAPCIERGELDECVEEAARLAGEMGIGAEELLDLSSATDMRGKYDFAYVLALAAVPGLDRNENASAYFNAGLAAQSLGKLKNSEEQYKLAIAADPKHASSHSNYANLLKELNRKEEAEEQYKQAIAANPKDAEAHSNYAVLLFELKRNEEAEEQYKLAIAANPNLAEVHYNYAILLSELKRNEEAEEQYKLAIVADPEYAPAHCNYAILLSELKRNEEAEEQYKLAIAADPEHAPAHCFYAILLSELKRNEEEEEQYKLAIAADPKQTWAHINYAILLSELKRNEEAEEQYKLAIAADLRLVDAHSNYTTLLSEIERNEGAERQYNMAIAADTELANAHKEYAKLLRNFNRNEEAEEHCKKAMAAYAKLVPAHYNYSILLSILKRDKEAEVHSENAIAADKRLLDVHFIHVSLLNDPEKIEKAEIQYSQYSHQAMPPEIHYAHVHSKYGLSLIDSDRRKASWKEIEMASSIFYTKGLITQSYLIKAWFYERYADKNLERKKFRESSEDISRAGEEYIKGSETVGGRFKHALEMMAYVCKARSFIRKEHRTNEKLVNHLKSASEFYKKASVCQAGGKEETCSACYSVMDVFSQTLTALEKVVNNKKPSISKEEWNAKLEKSNEIYIEKGSDKGVALVAALKQLIKCVDELAYYTARKSSLQKKRLKECYTTLADVSSKVEGGLRNITDPANEVIINYAKKMGIQIPEEKEFDEPPSTRNIKKLAGYLIILLGVIGSIIAILQFIKLDSGALEFIKSLITRSNP